MKLIYIRSTMEPKNYSTIRSILKKEQGEKIAPYIFKLADTKSLQTYLDKERITYEIYQEERVFKGVLEKKENWQNKKLKQIITFFSTLLIFNYLLFSIKVIF
jgi:hypothetical protein